MYECDYELPRQCFLLLLPFNSPWIIVCCLLLLLLLLFVIFRARKPSQATLKTNFLLYFFGLWSVDKEVQSSQNLPTPSPFRSVWMVFIFAYESTITMMIMVNGSYRESERENFVHTVNNKSQNSRSDLKKTLGSFCFICVHTDTDDLVINIGQIWIMRCLMRARTHIRSFIRILIYIFRSAKHLATMHCHWNWQ